MTREQAKETVKDIKEPFTRGYVTAIIDGIYDDFESKFTRVEIISAGGRVFCDKCDDNSHYKLSIQDDGKTLKLFEVKEKQ